MVESFFLHARAHRNIYVDFRENVISSERFCLRTLVAWNICADV